jgi:4-amino-4-deoxy-L-arabinose transferase-like glycosyltransferase
LNFPQARGRNVSESPEISAPVSAQQPLPLWQIFPLIFISVYLTHITLLRLPYYWDEAGYYIPAAYDFLRSGSLIPYSTLSNAHPPIPSIYLALWWKASGFLPLVTRIAMCIISSLALLGVYQLVLRITRSIAVAVAVTVLTLLYPVWFAQSTLAHADMFAAAATLWALCFCLRPEEDLRSYWIAAAFFSIAALSKETAIVTSLALGIVELVDRRVPIGQRCRRAAALFSPLLPLAAWYAYHRYKTGFIFGNPEYLRYNATSTLSALRIIVALGHRIFHLTAHMNLFVPVLCTAAAWMLPPRESALAGEALARPLEHRVLSRLWTVLIVNALLFSVIGGALLTRYLLPLYPLILLLCVYTWYRRVRGWGMLFVLSVVAFVLGIFINPPYRFSPEDNLSYRDMIALQQAAIHQMALHYRTATILTAWPATDELTKPELGYIRQPHSVVAINDFSLNSIRRAGQSNADFTVALVFSTKYDPPELPFSLGKTNQALDARFFNGHQDLAPEAIAQLLDGQVVWEASIKGQWAALIHFNRPQLASLSDPR